MLAILWGLLWALAGLVALLLILLLLVLFLPFDIHLRLDSDWAASDWEEEMTGAARWRARLRWGRVVADGRWEGEQFALTGSDVRLCGVRLRSRPGRRKEREPRQKRKRKRKFPDVELILALVEEGARFVHRLIRYTGMQVGGDVIYGFPDPALTGWCEAFRSSWQHLVPVRVAPAFDRPVASGWVHAHGRLYGYQVVAAAWRALDDPVIRGRLADKIRFKPIRYLLLRGGRAQWRTS